MAWTPPKEDKDTGLWTPPAGDKEVAAPTTSTTTPKYMSALRAIQDAATLGFDDEMLAALKSLPAALQGKYLDTYRQTVAEERASKAKALSDNPMMALTGQVAGSVVPGIGIGGALSKTAGAVTRDLPGMAQRMGAIGGIQGAAQGAGGAESIADIPREATIGGTVGAVAGAGLPIATAGATKAVGGPDALKRFTENYKSLRPEVTGSLGPMTIGGASGLGGGWVTGGNLGSLGENMSPENWTTDPYSRGLNAIEWGLTGALIGKGLKEAGRVGGAVQKTMRGEGGGTGKFPGTGSGSGAGNVDPSGNLPGGPGGAAPPSRTEQMQEWWKNVGGVLKSERPAAPKAPAGMSPEQARKDAMNKQSSAIGRAETNTDSPINESEAGKGAFDRIVRETTQSNVKQLPAKNLGELVPDENGVMVPRLPDKTEAATLRKLQTMPPNKNLPKPPGPGSNEGEGAFKNLVDYLRGGNTKSPGTMGMSVKEPDAPYKAPGAATVSESIDDLSRALSDPKGFAAAKAIRAGAFEDAFSKLENTKSWKAKGDVFDSNPKVDEYLQKKYGVTTKDLLEEADKQAANMYRKALDEIESGYSPEDEIFRVLKRKVPYEELEKNVVLNHDLFSIPKQEIWKNNLKDTGWEVDDWIRERLKRTMAKHNTTPADIKKGIEEGKDFIADKFRVPGNNAYVELNKLKEQVWQKIMSLPEIKREKFIRNLQGNNWIEERGLPTKNLHNWYTNASTEELRAALSAAQKF